MQASHQTQDRGQERTEGQHGSQLGLRGSAGLWEALSCCFIPQWPGFSATPREMCQSAVLLENNSKNGRDRRCLFYRSHPMRFIHTHNVTSLTLEAGFQIGPKRKGSFPFLSSLSIIFFTSKTTANAGLDISRQPPLFLRVALISMSRSWPANAPSGLRPCSLQHRPLCQAAAPRPPDGFLEFSSNALGQLHLPLTFLFA